MLEMVTADEVAAPLARHIQAAVERAHDADATPWPDVLPRDSVIRSRYDRIFGRAARLDSQGGFPLDDHAVSRALSGAEELAARAFGADRSFFVTCGTTVANQIAFEVAVGPGQRVLLDRTAHQSVHCAALRAPCEVEYTPVLADTEYPGSLVPDTAAILDVLQAATDEGRPFTVMAICASSYDGITYDLPRYLLACLERSPGLTFLIDEAWSAINNFHTELRRFTALAAAEFLAAKRGASPPMLVTHSAHKSMAAARQASYLHVVGDGDLVTRVEAAVLAHRPAMVNVPILVSLDLARAHAEADGKFLVDRALRCGERFRAAVRDDPALRAYGIAEFGAARPDAFRYLVTDRLKLMLDTRGVGLPPEQIKSILFRDYNVYISRTTSLGCLVTFTIGIDDTDRDRLCRALASLARRAAMRASRESARDIGCTDRRQQSLIIAYPPGVPISLPGEPDSPQVSQRIAFYRAAGADVYAIPAY